MNHIINLAAVKASAEQAKASSAELELWQMEISPDDVLRLVEVARAANSLLYRLHHPWVPSLITDAADGLKKTLEGIES